MIDIAEEIAELYHRDGIRSFEITGGCPLPREERSALRWVGGLKRILDSRAVGRIAVGINTRGRDLTPRVAESLAALGYTSRAVPSEPVTGVARDLQRALAAG